VWEETQLVVMAGLQPLLDIWPSSGETQDARAPRTRAPRVRAPVQQSLAFTRGPFAPPLRRRMVDLSDADLRRLWPGLSPADVREFAPWATSREEVYRIAFPAGTAIQEGHEAVVQLEPRVAAGINAERAARTTRTPRDIELVSPDGVPNPFRLRHPVFDASGSILRPPMPDVLSVGTIRQQMEWIQMATGQVVTVGNLSPVIGAAGAKTELFATRELERVLAIDIRRVQPGMQGLVNSWREQNVNLIESGIRAGATSKKLRPSMLSDISRVIERGHADGLRVEQLAGGIAERFGVSKSRAELIARDQTLKLNAQVNQARQTQVGITRYRWSTSGDSNVRDGHQRLNGDVFEWASPPDVGDGRHEHPGGDFQCRCVAVPVFEPGDPLSQ